jgi:hypothetical protein
LSDTRANDYNGNRKDEHASRSPETADICFDAIHNFLVKVLLLKTNNPGASASVHNYTP